MPRTGQLSHTASLILWKYIKLISQLVVISIHADSSHIVSGIFESLVCTVLLGFFFFFAEVRDIINSSQQSLIDNPGYTAIVVGKYEASVEVQLMFNAKW